MIRNYNLLKCDSLYFSEENYGPRHHHAFPADPTDGQLFETPKKVVNDGNLGHGFLHRFGVGNVEYSLNKMQRWTLPGLVKDSLYMKSELSFFDPIILFHVLRAFENICNCFRIYQLLLTVISLWICRDSKHSKQFL